MEKLKIFASIIEEEAKNQIYGFVKSPASEGAIVRIMPDVHAGKGCVVGFTCSFEDTPQRIVPNIIGVDIGCGMTAYRMEGIDDIDYEGLDSFIRRKIPSGSNVHDGNNSWTLYGKTAKTWFSYRERGERLTLNLKCHKELKNLKHLYYAMGSLGGGNHFIEIDKDSNGEFWLVVHSGSRNLGLQVAKIYQKKADFKGSKEYAIKQKISEAVTKLKSEGRFKEIEKTIEKIKAEYKPKATLSQDLQWVDGYNLEDYIHDQNFCVEWAKLNREMMVRVIMECWFKTPIKPKNFVNSIHNYISTDHIIRKGACSAYEGDDVIIPMNMRDGVLYCKGKGNPDWNYSAPHGAGRLMSRNRAFKELTLVEFAKEMEGVNSWSVSRATLDESPMAYKPMDSITELISDTVEIVDIWKPIYNFKAGE